MPSKASIYLFAPQKVPTHGYSSKIINLHVCHLLPIIPWFKESACTWWVTGGAPPCKDTSWCNEEVKVAIKIKRNSYRDLKKNCDVVSFERYKLAKKEATKAIQNAKVKVYKEVYEKLDTKEVEKDIYRIARIRERD